jgi:hypothetical protein
LLTDENTKQYQSQNSHNKYPKLIIFVKIAS